jgi:hypothetical protein
VILRTGGESIIGFNFSISGGNRQWRMGRTIQTSIPLTTGSILWLVRNRSIGSVGSVGSVGSIVHRSCNPNTGTDRTNQQIADKVLTISHPPGPQCKWRQLGGKLLSFNPRPRYTKPPGSTRYHALQKGAKRASELVVTALKVSDKEPERLLLG